MGPRNRPGAFAVRLAAIALGSAIALPMSASGVSAAGLLASYQAYPVGSWPDAVAIGDVTGDGRPDVVMTTSYYFDPANDFRLWVFAQGSDGALAAPVSYATSATYTDRAESVAIGDITGDGRADVVLGLDGLGVQVFPQDASGRSARRAPCHDRQRQDPPRPARRRRAARRRRRGLGLGHRQRPAQRRQRRVRGADGLPGPP